MRASLAKARPRHPLKHIRLASGCVSYSLLPHDARSEIWKAQAHTFPLRPVMGVCLSNLSTFKARQSVHRVVPTQWPVCRRWAAFAVPSRAVHRTGQRGRNPRQEVVPTSCRGFLFPAHGDIPTLLDRTIPTAHAVEVPNERVLLNGRCYGNRLCQTIAFMAMP